MFEKFCDFLCSNTKKFITVEMNDYFETKMLKRLKYTMFGNSGGIKPQRDSGISQFQKNTVYPGGMGGAGWRPRGNRIGYST